MQYFLGPNGEITSFNYDILLQVNSNDINPNPNQLSNLKVRGVGYMNNMDYSICFRKEQYFCTQTYSVNNSNTINTLNDESFSVPSDRVSADSGGAGVSKCPRDFLELGGIRYCGYRLNPRAINQDVNTNEPVIDEGFDHYLSPNKLNMNIISFQKWSNSCKICVRQYRH